jgi:preprotein translocase subunit SecG
MIGALTFLLYILSIAIIGLVLIQPDRSNGISGGIGNGASNQVFGISKDGGPLAKATKIAGALFMVVSLLIYIKS